MFSKDKWKWHKTAHNALIQDDNFVVGINVATGGQLEIYLTDCDCNYDGDAVLVTRYFYWFYTPSCRVTILLEKDVHFVGSLIWFLSCIEMCTNHPSLIYTL